MIALPNPHQGWSDEIAQGPIKWQEARQQGKPWTTYLFLPKEDISAYELALISMYSKGIEQGYAPSGLLSIVGRHFLPIEDAE